jgi:hypothetical protein
MKSYSFKCVLLFSTVMINTIQVAVASVKSLVLSFFCDLYGDVHVQ